MDNQIFDISDLRMICGVMPSLIQQHEIYTKSLDEGRRLFGSILSLKPIEQKRIIIIGAGITGITAGWLLKQLGHDVIILESDTNHRWLTRETIAEIDLTCQLFLFLCQHFGIGIESNVDRSFNSIWQPSHFDPNKLVELEWNIGQVLTKISSDSMQIDPLDPLTSDTNIFLNNKLKSWDKMLLSDRMAEWLVPQSIKNVLEQQLGNPNYLGLLYKVRGNSHNDPYLYWDMKKLIKCPDSKRIVRNNMAAGLNIKFDFDVKTVSHATNSVVISNGKKFYSCDDVIITMPREKIGMVKFSPNIDLPFNGEINFVQNIKQLYQPIETI